MTTTDALLLGIFVLLFAQLLFQGRFAVGVREELDGLRDQVAAVETKGDSIIAALLGIAALMEQNAADPAEIRALAERLKEQVTEFQTAIDTVPPPTP